MNMNPQHLPKSFKVITHLASIFLFSVLCLLISFGAFLQLSGSATEIAFRIILTFVLLGALVFLYYALAGGLEWRNENLPLIRVVLFWVLSAGVYGLIFWGIWIMVRKIMAKIYKIPYEEVKGRLLNYKPANTKTYCISCHQFVGGELASTRRKVTCFPDDHKAYQCASCACRYSTENQAYAQNRVFVQIESVTDCQKVLLSLPVSSDLKDASSISSDERLSVDDMGYKLFRFWMERIQLSAGHQGASYYWGVRLGDRSNFTREVHFRDGGEVWDDFYVSRLSDTEYSAKAWRHFGINGEGQSIEV